MRFVAPTSIPCSSAAFAELCTDLLESGRSVRFEARGTSMSPLVRDGDVVLVQPVDAKAVRVADVVLFSSEAGRVVVHRVIRKRAGEGGLHFTLQGDQLAQPDGVIPEAQVYGKVVAIDRQGVRIETGRPLVRILGYSMVLRSRWRLGRGRPYRLARALFKRLPILSKHLA